VDISQVSNDYLSWVQENQKYIQLADSSKIDIQTPFLDPYGDNISFVAERVGNQIRFSDEGYTLWNLEMNGFRIRKQDQVRYKLLSAILLIDRVRMNDKNEIFKVVDTIEIGQTIHEMTQAILKVYELNSLKKEIVQSVFREDVAAYFESNENDFRFMRDFSITGRSQLSYSFDYVFIGKNSRKILRIQENLTRTVVESMIATVADTAEFRLQHSSGKEEFGLLLKNIDRTNQNTIDLLASLRKYDVFSLNFENKEDVHSFLSA
jgi:hypothetical protein